MCFYRATGELFHNKKTVTSDKATARSLGNALMKGTKYIFQNTFNEPLKFYYFCSFTLTIFQNCQKYDL